MPFSVIVPDVVMDESWQFSKRHKLGHRGDGSDGNVEQQLVGVIGQNMVNLGLCQPLMQHDTGFDGGIDFQAFGINFDVKTMGRSRYPEPHYVNNLLRSQINYDCHAYLFLSFNKSNRELTFCGWLPKEMFLYRATLYRQGTERERNDGTTFELKADTFEIQNKDLYNDFTSWPELIAQWYRHAEDLL